MWLLNQQRATMATSSNKRITKVIVDALRPGQVAWDGQVKGFGVRCQARGKFYVLKYRAGGRQRWYTIGRHGSPWTADTARREAFRLLGEIKSAKDPSQVREQNKQALTIGQLADRFLDEHVRVKRKSRTTEEYERLVEKFIRPALGQRRSSDITRADIAKLHHGLRGTPYQANRVLAVLSKMLNLAEAWGERPDGSNPCRHVEKYKERKRERLLSPDELARLGSALARAEQAFASSNGPDLAPVAGNQSEEPRVGPYPIAAIRLLIFTGARLNEILTLHWQFVDLERGEARLPDSKTGSKTLHLPPPAIEVLASLPRMDDNPYVIAGHKAGAHMVNLQKPWQAVRKAASLESLRLHDLRHAFASVAATSGMGLPIIGKMLGHTQPQTTARYAHLADDPVKVAAASVAEKIASAMTGTEAELLDLKDRR